MSKKDEILRKGKPVKPGTIDVVAVSMATIINEENKDELVTSNNARLETYEPISTELQNGMTIRAHDGGSKQIEEDNER